MFGLQPNEITALATSLSVAGRAIFFSLPFAVLIAYALARWRFPGRAVLDALVHLPLVLPPVLIGFLLLITFGRQAPIGALLAEQFGVRLVFTVEGAALAAAIMVFPLLVRALRLAFESVDAGLGEAAAVLGAGPVERFFVVTAPLAAPGAAAAIVTAFAAALGEFGAVITFAANVPGETQTLPLAIYAALQQPGGEAAALRLAALSFSLAVAGLFIGEALARWARRRFQR